MLRFLISSLSLCAPGEDFSELLRVGDGELFQKVTELAGIKSVTRLSRGSKNFLSLGKAGIDDCRLMVKELIADKPGLLKGGASWPNSCLLFFLERENDPDVWRGGLIKVLSLMEDKEGDVKLRPFRGPSFMRRFFPGVNPDLAHFWLSFAQVPEGCTKLVRAASYGMGAEEARKTLAATFKASASLYKWRCAGCFLKSPLDLDRYINEGQDPDSNPTLKWIEISPDIKELFRGIEVPASREDRLEQAIYLTRRWFYRCALASVHDCLSACPRYDLSFFEGEAIFMAHAIHCDPSKKVLSAFKVSQEDHLQAFNNTCPACARLLNHYTTKASPQV